MAVIERVREQFMNPGRDIMTCKCKEEMDLGHTEALRQLEQKERELEVWKTAFEEGFMKGFAEGFESKISI